MYSWREAIHLYRPSCLASGTCHRSSPSMRTQVPCHRLCVFLIALFCILSLSAGLPLPTQSSPRSIQPTHRRPPHTKPTTRRITGVWRVTRYASILGPTIAIYLYGRLTKLYEKYGPIVTTQLKEVLKYASSNRGLSAPRQSLSLRSSRRETTPYSLQVANEVIRKMNRRLREDAVIARIQMDDDQYEFNRLPSGSEMRQMATEVMREVMNEGAGKFLAPNERYVVRKMVLRSIR